MTVAFNIIADRDPNELFVWNVVIEARFGNLRCPVAKLQVTAYSEDEAIELAFYEHFEQKPND